MSRWVSERVSRWSWSAGLCAALLLCAGTARAGTITTELYQFTGAEATVTVVLDDMTDPGNIVITLTVEDPPSIGDLRGFFFDVADDSLLAGMMITGDEVTKTAFSASSVVNLGRGSNMHGGGGPCPCDAGVEIGTSGIGKDDYQTVTFTLSHETEALDLSIFDGQFLGARITSVGTVDGPRKYSSKLIGTVTVPEPSSGLLLGLALVAIVPRRRR